MNITVSSSLEGRDLALLKSVINILDPSDFDVEATHWRYRDTPNYQIFVAQEFHHECCEYYALLKAEEKRISIGDNINPKILRQLFGQLEQGKLSAGFEAESHFSNGYHTDIQTGSSFVEQLYHYMSSQALLNVNLACHSGNRLMIDKTNDRIYATQPLTASSAKKLLDEKNISLCLTEKDNKVDAENYPHQTTTSQFLWMLGLAFDETLLLDDFSQANVTFRQVNWPDYGCLPFSNTFVSLSALVSHNAHTFESLLSYGQFNKKDVIAFLNASCLSGCTIVNRTNQDIEVVLNKSAANSNSFLSRLKLKLFGNNSIG